MVKSVILDFDGVLVDSLNSVYNIYKIIAEKLGVTIPSTVREFGDAFAGDYRELFRKIGINTREKVSRALEIFRDHSSKLPGMSKPFPGIKAILSALKAAGYRIGIVSNNWQDHIERTLEKMGVRGHIDAVVGLNGLSKMKPDPTQLFVCMDKLGSTPGETVYIGDMETDILAAKAAGVRAAAATYGVHSEERLSRFKPDCFVRSPAEILDVVS